MAGIQVTAKWVTPPSALARAVEQYGDRVFVAVKAVADYIAQLMQDHARATAPWTDRTGNARAGLFGVAEQAASDLVIIYLSHSVTYGKFLELAHGQRFRVISPTIEKHLPIIEAMLQDIFR